MMQPKLGILAGKGDLPRDVIAACREQSRPFFVLGFKGQTPKDLLDADSVDHAWVRLGALGRAIAILKDAGVEEVIMAGAMERPSLTTLMPDAEAMRFLASGALNKGDDGLLKALVDYLETSAGLKVVGIDDVLPSQLAEAGVWTSHQPDADCVADIDKGIEIAKGLGRYDVGQGVVVQQGIVIALEAVEGTERMIERAGGLRLEGRGPVLVKVAKPGQERRADLPAFGPETITQAAKAGFAGIAVGAEEVVVMGKADVIERADQAGLFIIGIDTAPKP